MMGFCFLITVPLHRWIRSHTHTHTHTRTHTHALPRSEVGTQISTLGFLNLCADFRGGPVVKTLRFHWELRSCVLRCQKKESSPLEPLHCGTSAHLFSAVSFASFQITAPHLCLCRTVGSCYCEQFAPTTHIFNYFLWHKQENINVSVMSLTLK